MSAARYAVVGNPIAHSRSPEIHAAFAEATGQDIVYEKLLAPVDGFAAVAAQFFADGGHGLNVTVPFKADAFAWVHELGEQARIAGAVNTILRADGRYIGENTDGRGLVADLQRHRVSVKGRKVLLLGAGGAVAGVLPALIAEQPGSLTVANRTIARAEALAARFADFMVVSACGLDAGLADDYELVINATSAGLEGQGLSLPVSLATGAVCYDMTYGPKAAFFRWSRPHAELAVDGLGMLVEQAACAFELWRGVHPPTDAVHQLLRGDHA